MEFDYFNYNYKSKRLMMQLNGYEYTQRFKVEF